MTEAYGLVLPQSRGVAHYLLMSEWIRLGRNIPAGAFPTVCGRDVRGQQHNGENEYTLVAVEQIPFGRPICAQCRAGGVEKARGTLWR